MQPHTAAETTAWVLTVLVFLLIGFDLMMGFRFGTSTTVSHQLLEVGQRYPILSFAFGVLVGHVFWPQRGN